MLRDIRSMQSFPAEQRTGRSRPKSLSDVNYESISAATMETGSSNSPSPDNDAGDLLLGPPRPAGAITGGVLVITAALGLSFASISTCIWFFIRNHSGLRFAKDDVASVASVMFAVVQSIFIIFAVKKGLGGPKSDFAMSNSPTWNLDIYFSDILYVLAIWITKQSVIIAFLRCSQERAHIVTTKALSMVSAAFMVISVLIVAVRCALAHPWLPNSRCTALFQRWVVVSVFDILTEIGIFVMALLIVSSLQLPLNKKRRIMLAFGLRLPIIGLSLIRLIYLEPELSSTSSSPAGCVAALCAQIQMFYTIVTATISGLMLCLASTNAQLHHRPSAETLLKMNESLCGSSQSLDKLCGSNGLCGDESHALPELRWDGTLYKVEVKLGDAADRGAAPDIENKMVIARNVTWAVEFGDSSSGRDL